MYLHCNYSLTCTRILLWLRGASTPIISYPLPDRLSRPVTGDGMLREVCPLWLVWKRLSLGSAVLRRGCSLPAGFWLQRELCNIPSSFTLSVETNTSEKHTHGIWWFHLEQSHLDHLQFLQATFIQMALWKRWIIDFHIICMTSTYDEADLINFSRTLVCSLSFEGLSR